MGTDRGLGGGSEMTRRSKRELERALEELDRRGSTKPSDVSVRAPFVSYGKDADAVDVPEGWTSRIEQDGDGPTYQVLERDADPSEGSA